MESYRLQPKQISGFSSTTFDNFSIICISSRICCEVSCFSVNQYFLARILSLHCCFAGINNFEYWKESCFSCQSPIHSPFMLKYFLLTSKAGCFASFSERIGFILGATAFQSMPIAESFHISPPSPFAS